MKTYQWDEVDEYIENGIWFDGVLNGTVTLDDKKYYFVMDSESRFVRNDVNVRVFIYTVHDEDLDPHTVETFPQTPPIALIVEAGAYIPKEKK